MKRGQSEIIGLVVVVLILVFALIFFVKFKNSDSDDESKLIRFNLRANSALNALMKVHTEIDDERMQMKDFIEECISREPIDCSKVEEDLEHQLNFALANSEDYQLIVSKEGDDVFSLGKGCKSSISASPFILRHGERIEFKICT